MSDVVWSAHDVRVGSAGGVVGDALEQALTWLDDAPRLAYASAGVAPVFGLADGNLANYLADGVGVRIVDFEDSGVSDRAFELAEITEHVASWVECPLDAEDFLARFELMCRRQAGRRGPVPLAAHSVNGASWHLTEYVRPVEDEFIPFTE